MASPDVERRAAGGSGTFVLGMTADFFSASK
jgi:hypothetical protein